MKRPSIARRRAISGQFPNFPGAVEASGLIHTSGLVDARALSGENRTAREQMDGAMAELVQVLAAAGASLDHVVQVTAFLTSTHDLGHWNDVYGAVWSESGPARTSVICGLAKPELAFEVQAVAVLN